MKEYVVNLNNHILQHFKSSTRRQARQLLASKGVSKERTGLLVFKMLEAFEGGVTLPAPPDAREDLTSVLEDMKRHATSQHLMLKRMFEHLGTIEDKNKILEKKERERKERKGRDERKRRKKKKKRCKERKKKKRERKEKEERMEKTFSLVPLYSHTPKYVTIDTDALWGLLGGRTGTGVSLQDFASKQNLLWPTVFKIPACLLGLDNGPKKAFDYMVKTDGVGVSVVCCRWVREPLRVTEEHCERTSGDLGSDAVWVGIDPGTKSIVSTAREGDAHSGYSLSNKRFYHDCKMHERTFAKDLHLKEAGLLEWLKATPSPKTSRSVNMVEHLAHLLGSPLYAKVLDIHHHRREKLLRWKVNIHKKKTLDAACKAIIGDTPKDKLVVAFGDASWTTNLRGSRPGPRRKWVSERLRRVHGVRVVDVNEYNTSQVCSGCGG